MSFITYKSNSGGTMITSAIFLVSEAYVAAGKNVNKYDVFLNSRMKLTLEEGVDATRKEFVDYWMAPSSHRTSEHVSPAP